MDSSYKQKKPWMNSRGGNNGSSDNWGGFQSGQDPGPERSSLSLAGWSPYADTSRRPVASNDFQAAPQRSGTRWSRDHQSEWNEMRGGGGAQAAPNSWSGPSNGDKWSDSRMMQQQQQQQHVQMHGDIIEPPQGQMDGFLHGFNGAGRDWFYRYLDMGCSPEDARDRVLDRNRKHPESLHSSLPDGRYADSNAQVERRNTSGGRRLPPEPRSETSNLDLTGLSGASRKWFKRYLASGCTPEEALGKVLEYKRNYPNGPPVQSSPAVGGRRLQPESRSETSNPDPNALNGASRKWFNRYLESGCTPEEALAKVLEYKRNNPNGPPVQSSPAVGGRKRPLDDKAREEPKKPRTGKELPPAAAVSSNKNRLTVAVVAENHPMHVLQKQQLSKVENAITEEMIKGWTHSLNFAGIRYRPGMLLVTCLDKRSKEWLEMMVPKITVIKGVSLRVYKEGEIPGTKGITIFVPRGNEEPDEVTMGFIKEQNTDLQSQYWSLVRGFKTQNGKILTISIGDKSMDLLVKRGMKVSYRFAQLSCRITKAPLIPQARKKKAPKETPKSHAEIDLTEEDGDMEISDMTVLDEVQGDDDDEEEVCEAIAEDEAEAEAVGEDDNEVAGEDDAKEIGEDDAEEIGADGNEEDIINDIEQQFDIEDEQ